MVATSATPNYSSMVTRCFLLPQESNFEIFLDIDAKPRKPISDEYTEFDKHQKSGIPVPLSDPPIISRMTDRHCTLSWKPSVPSYARAPVTYQLEMCELPQGDWFTARSGIRNCDCTVGNLEPFRDYRFRIRIENKYGISDPSPYATTFRYFSALTLKT